MVICYSKRSRLDENKLSALSLEVISYSFKCSTGGLVALVKHLMVCFHSDARSSKFRSFRKCSQWKAESETAMTDRQTDRRTHRWSHAVL